MKTRHFLQLGIFFFFFSSIVLSSTGNAVIIIDGAYNIDYFDLTYDQGELQLFITAGDGHSKYLTMAESEIDEVGWGIFQDSSKTLKTYFNRSGIQLHNTSNKKVPNEWNENNNTKEIELVPNSVNIDVDKDANMDVLI